MVRARLADKLSRDDSIFAIHPGDRTSLGALIEEVGALNAEARARKTKAKDQWGYQWWCKACDAINTPAIRPTDHLFEEREAVIASHAVMFMAGHMRPGRKGRAAADPHSAWDAYKKSRVVLEEWGCRLPDIALVRRTLRGTLRNYVELYGDEVLVPDRKRPFSREHELKILSLLNARMMPGWGEKQCRMLEAAMSFARCTAARKAELCSDDNPHYFSRANLTWYVNGVEVTPTPENIKRATRLRIRPAASKADPFNIHWGSICMWFDLTPGEHMSVALAMQQLELEYPCPPKQRKRYPILFDPEAPPADVPKPVTRAWLTRRFAQLMEAALGKEAAALRSWHSWRVTLACALRAAVDAQHPEGRSLDLIKVFGRWRSDDAVKIYGRLRSDEYARHVSASLRADAGSLEAGHEAAAMESVDPVGIFEQIATASDENTEPNSGGAPHQPSPPKAATAGAGTKRKRGAASTTAPRRQRRALSDSAPSARAEADREVKAKAVARPQRRAKRGCLRTSPTPPPSTVIVPASCFPSEECSENGGRGWSATVTPAVKGQVKVTFTHARDESGRRFASVVMRASALTYVEASALT